MIRLWSVLLASILWLSSCLPHPPQPPPPLRPPPVFNLDYFKAYNVDIIKGRDPGTVTVNDQFIKIRSPQGVQVTPTKIKYFATAVQKNDIKIKNPLAHLAWYRIPDGVVREFEVTFLNQMTNYENKKIKINRLRSILVPTGKKGEGFPNDLDHYLCYQVVGGDATTKQVTLVDPQFKQEGKVKAIGPQFFCNPCSKDKLQIKNREDHLTVYVLDPGRFVNKNVSINNQFDGQDIKINDQIYLFVPTKKIDFSPYTAQPSD